VSGAVALASCSKWPGGSGDHAGVVEALAERGVRADWVPWDDPHAQWAEYDLVVLRETWDYPSKLAEFLAWVEWLATETAVANPPSVVQWNHHKRYLLDLASAGVRTVPTAVVTAGDPEPEGALVRNAAGVVVKPAVGIGGDDAVRGAATDPAIGAHLHALLGAGDVLVQPYLQSVETTGETSVIVLAGRVSHAVTKRPAVGEFRVHEHRGGIYGAAEASAAEAEVALAACEVARARTGADPLYARADLVVGPDGEPLIMELELIEPSLYLQIVPAAAATFAEAVVSWLER
jgi:glutathione synthase/RimK-type ligase-like ATP-grasp enzyme